MWDNRLTEDWGLLHRDLSTRFLLAFPDLWMLLARDASEAGSASTTSPSLVCAALSGPRCCVLCTGALRCCIVFFTSCSKNTRAGIAHRCSSKWKMTGHGNELIIGRKIASWIWRTSSSDVFALRLALEHASSCCNAFNFS